MCGIVVLAGEVPNPVAVMAIAGAGARGPHSHGWALANGDGWTVLRYPGRLIYETQPRLLGVHMKGPYIGHSRLATSGGRAGDAPLILESQPYVSAGHYLIAHNGTIPDELTGRLPGDVDTKALLRGLEAGVEPVEMLRAAARPQAAVWAIENVLWACRIDGVDQPAHPLYVARGPGWTAISSGRLAGGRLIEVGRAIAVWA